MSCQFENEILRERVECYREISDVLLKKGELLEYDLARVMAERDSLRQQLAEKDKKIKWLQMELDAGNDCFIENISRVTAERDAALNDLRGKCSACVNYMPNHDGVICLTCGWLPRTVPFLLNNFWTSDCWQWRGLQKEDE